MTASKDLTRSELVRYLSGVPRHRWHEVAIVVDAMQGVRVMSRPALVAWLRRLDMHDEASSASSRRVPPGAAQVVYVSRDGARLKILDGERRPVGTPRGSTQPLSKKERRS